MPPLRLLKQSDLLQKSSNTMEVFQTSRDRSVVVEASAGTGKTFALEELVLELALVERIPLQKILLVTFTEKATQELRTRLRSRLREIVDAAQSGKAWLGQEGSGSHWEIDAPRLEQLKAALLDFDEFRFTQFMDSATVCFVSSPLKTVCSSTSNRPTHGS